MQAVEQRQHLNEQIERITPLDEGYYRRMELQLDGLTKPVGALGRMETLVMQLAGIQATMRVQTKPRVSIIMCADNGVVEEGVSSCPQEVTKTVTHNFTRGITAMNQLSTFAGAAMHVVDVGVKDCPHIPGIHTCKVREGTANMVHSPAMTTSDVLQAIQVGIDQVSALAAEGYCLFGTGEMGIGNTTTSAAMTAVLLDLPVEEVTGRGAGALSDVYTQKVAAIKKALAHNQPDKDDPIDVLAKVGGLDIAGLVGVYLGCAIHKRMVVVDGFISATSALLAYRLCSHTKAYMVASHLSKEGGMQYVLEAIGLRAHLDLDMRLGEGSGCPVMFQLIDMACYTLLGMGTFEDAGVDKQHYEHIWK